MKLRNDKRGSAGIGVLLLVVGLLMCSIVGGMFFFSVAPNYNKTVHAYMENARWGDDPVAMKANLIQAKAGMIALGLTNDTYSTVLPWSQTKANQMSTQYTQIDIQINRCDALTRMNVTDYNYQSTLQSVQNWIYDSNGWGDEVAQGAYMYVMNFAYLMFIIMGALAAILGLILASMEV